MCAESAAVPAPPEQPPESSVALEPPVALPAAPPTTAIDLAIERTMSAAREEIAVTSGELLDLDDVAPSNEFGGAAPPGKKPPEPADAPAASLAAGAPSASPVAADDVLPVDFRPATEQPPAEPPPAAPPPKPLAASNPSIDVMREIELELFASDDAATSAATPEAAAAPQAAPKAARAALRQQLSFAAARQAATAPSPERPVPSDPLAALKALSDEERIALFT